MLHIKVLEQGLFLGYLDFFSNLKDLIHYIKCYSYSLIDMVAKYLRLKLTKRIHQSNGCFIEESRVYN